MNENFSMVAKTFAGFEEVLARELLMLGAANIQKGKRNVRFDGDKGFMYKANLGLHTALSILKPIFEFSAQNENDLYQKVKKLPWEKYLNTHKTFLIEPTIHSKIFSHSHFAALKTKDAIVDRFNEKKGKRPSISKTSPDVKLNLHIDHNKCTISLDSSGESLHKRGYKKAIGKAPLNEVLASGIIALSGWDYHTDFVDPMCGSGTFLIEAVFRAAQIPPNFQRKYFGFMNWNDWDEKLYEVIRMSLLKRVKDFKGKLQGYDSSNFMVKIALENIKNAQVEEFVHVEKKDFFKDNNQNETPLFMMMNPPYDERFKIDVPAFYSNIGSTLKHHYDNTHVWIFTANTEGIKSLGLRPKKKIPLYNGKLEAKLLYYPMYSGSKKIHKKQIS